jgi:proteasome lid subunit RPN8/RPN11
MQLDQSVLSEIIDHLEQAYPQEGCGVVLERTGRVWVHTMRNAYDEYHQADPASFPRTSRTAYFFDPKEWMMLLQNAERGGTRIASIFHSHADAGAYFSTEDSNMAAPDGLPLFPDVAYLVVSVVGGRARDAQVFMWNGSSFTGRPVPLPS